MISISKIEKQDSINLKSGPTSSVQSGALGSSKLNLKSGPT
jgi:hypothetical protein